MEQNRMDDIKLLGRYEYALKRMTYEIIGGAGTLFIGAIVVGLKYKHIYWTSFILAGIGLLGIGVYFIMRRYINKKIKEIKERMKDKEIKN